MGAPAAPLGVGATPPRPADGWPHQRACHGSDEARAAGEGVAL